MAVIHLTKDNFKEEVLESNVPVLVDFWATWCGPCQMVGPVIEEIAGEVTDAKICKVDVDANPELARDYRVMSIPTLMVFKNGEAVKREVGAKPKAEMPACTPGSCGRASYLIIASLVYSFTSSAMISTTLSIPSAVICS